MMPPSHSSARPFAAPLLALLLLVGGGLAPLAGAPACAPERAMDCCPLAAAAPDAGCHGTALLASDCCDAAEASPAAVPAGAGFALQVADAPSPAPHVEDALPRPRLALPRAPERPAEDGLYTLHQSFLI